MNIQKNNFNLGDFVRVADVPFGPLQIFGICIAEDFTPCYVVIMESPFGAVVLSDVPESEITRQEPRRQQERAPADRRRLTNTEQFDKGVQHAFAIAMSFFTQSEMSLDRMREFLRDNMRRANDRIAEHEASRQPQ